MISEEVKTIKKSIERIDMIIQGQYLGSSTVPDLPLLLAARIQADIDSLDRWADEQGITS